jgi:hypothetical protein
VDRREAFHAAVIKFRSPEWSPAFPDTDTVEVDGKYRTIREVCWLLKRDTGELPDIIVGELMKAMRGDRRLLQQLGRTRTYATGSQCLLELLEERVRTFKGKR